MTDHCPSARGAVVQVRLESAAAARRAGEFVSVTTAGNGRFLPVATDSFGSFLPVMEHEACWSNPMQWLLRPNANGGQVECNFAADTSSISTSPLEAHLLEHGCWQTNRRAIAPLLIFTSPWVNFQSAPNSYPSRLRQVFDPVRHNPSTLLEQRLEGLP